MALQFVLGNSGAGKSYQLFQTIIKEAEKHPKKNFLVIVPEQFTMQTQKELVRLSPNHGLMNIDVLSFQRLAFRILQETGGEKRQILEEIGKTLVLQRIVQEQGDALQVLGSSLRKPGTIQEMKSLVSELIQYDITPEQMDEVLQRTEGKPLLSYKLKDIQVIYQGFSEYLRDRYLTGEEVLDVLCDWIDESRLMKNCEVIFDGFTGFTPIQNKLMRKILVLAERVWVTITLDPRTKRELLKSPHNLFHMSGVMLEKMVKLAQEEHVEIEEELWIREEEKDRFSGAPALRFLEQNLFRYGRKTEKSISYENEQEEIQLFVASNPKEEMEEIARKIRHLVRTKGYRYGDFGVITGDLSTYGTYARQVMEARKIPCFVDEKHSILMNPFVEYMRAGLNMISEHFTYESVFRYLRCGLSTLSIYEIDQLENYCIATGIRGWKQWKQHWIRVYKGIDEKQMEEINTLREKFLQEVQKFVEKMMKKNLSVLERSRILYEFICKSQIEERLQEKKRFFEEEGELALAKEYDQIYEIIISMLDKMVMILGEEEISLLEYQQLLEAGFEEARVGVIPPTADQVLVGDMERTRLKDIKVLFFAGVNDSVIPKRKTRGGLLSESDREYLEGQKVELAPSAREAMYIQRFYLYLNLTKPSKQLYLSFSRSNGQGQAQGPAYLISMILHLFPKLHVQEENENTIYNEEIPEQAVDTLLKEVHSLREQEPSIEWKELYSWYLSHPEWEALCKNWLSQAFCKKPEDQLGKGVAHAIYGKELNTSVTRLEKFAACAYAHFLQYGMQLEKRKEYEFRPVDLGNVMHQALEQFSKNLKKERISWKDLTKEQRETLIDTSVDELICDYGNTILKSSARNQYMVLRIKRILRRTVWALQEQIGAGDFEPSKFEVSFVTGDELEATHFTLSSDEKITLRGRIDRVDRYEKDEKIYIKVVDYKSGNTSMDLIALYHGLQLQLVVYLNAAMEMEQRNYPDKDVKPAGVFYYRMKDPLLDGEMDEEEEEIEKRLLKELKVDGLVLDKKEIIHHMDKTLENGTKSDVIPVAINANGKLSSTSKVATPEQFSYLSGYVSKKIKKIGREILDGNVDINPYQRKQKTACDYCEFKGICGFDERIPGYHFRKLAELDKEEIWDKLKEEE